MGMIGTRDYQQQAYGPALASTRRNSRVVERLDVVKGTTVSFTSTATIADSGSGMGAVGVGDVVEIRGSASNSRDWRATAAAAGELTVVPALVTTIAATPLIQIVRMG